MVESYLEAHGMIRSITGIGSGKGPYISIHDGFTGISKWYACILLSVCYIGNLCSALNRADFLPNSDRIVLDTHPYFAFDGSPNIDPLSTYDQMPCNSWANGMNTSQTDFGITVAGEFSNAVGLVSLFYFINT